MILLELDDFTEQPQCFEELLDNSVRLHFYYYKIIYLQIKPRPLAMKLAPI